MQTGRNAAASARDAASNVAASAKSGLDKTKATGQEKGERMTSHDPIEKDMATKKKEEKIHEAEMNKEMTHDENEALKQERRPSASGVHKALEEERKQLGTGGAHTGTQRT
ncbi:hypothetical protein MKW94_008711 [Papaver nudicaule]|uniref:Uncharacterized protein n=1 Tax=Papaver nudicaule TaxID=74823 RepID=A0AA41VNA8_PAPNU|nr:hypothetical protein [Papaver nudicaule]